MNKLPVALTAAALVLFSAGTGFAQQKGGVEVNGFLANSTVANGNTNASIGFDSKARQSIGSVHAATVNGFLSNTTVANGNSNAAVGFKSNACQQIGAIGKYRDKDGAFC